MTTSASPLYISGRVDKGRAVVAIGQREFSLPSTPFEVFALLVVARLEEPEFGYATREAFGIDSDDLFYKTLERLRKHIDAGLGRGAGHALVRTHGKAFFSLNVRAASIQFGPRAAALAPGFLPTALMERLLGANTECHPGVRATS